MSRVEFSTGVPFTDVDPTAVDPWTIRSLLPARRSGLRGRLSLLIPTLGLIVGLFATGCAPSTPSVREQAAPEPSTKPRIVATSHPPAFVVAYLAEDLVDLELVVPAEGDPAHGSPTSEQILAVQSADLVISHGLGYEQWMTTASLPESKIVRTAKELDVVRTTGRTHSHGRQGEHSHTAVDPKTWMDPSLLRQQAEVVQRSLAELWPELAAPTRERLSSLEEQLRALDDDLQDLFDPEGLEARTFRASEPERYGYWQRKYGFKVERSEQAGSPELLWIVPPSQEPAAEPCAAHIDLLDQPTDGKVYDYLVQARANIEHLRAGFELCRAESAQSSPDS